jgi:hypothetical protein
MGALLALSSIFGLLYVKHVAAAKAAGGSTAGASGSLTITGAPDPSVAYDTKSPSQGSPIGNTHLSIADPVFSSGGDIVAMPYRPSDVEYGGGISQLAGVEQDPAPSGSVGSGISAIEKLNAPHAGPRINGGVTGRQFIPDFLPRIPLFQRVTANLTAAARTGDTGSGKLPFVPANVGGIAQRHPVSPLRPTIEIRHSGVATTAAHLGAAINQPTSQTRPPQETVASAKPGAIVRAAPRSQIYGRRVVNA